MLTGATAPVTTVAENLPGRQHRGKQQHGRRQHDDLRRDTGYVPLQDGPAVGSGESEGGMVKADAQSDADDKQPRRAGAESEQVNEETGCEQAHNRQRQSLHGNESLVHGDHGILSTIGPGAR